MSRSTGHLEADLLQEKIVTLGRVRQLWTRILVLIAGAGLAWYFSVDATWIVVGTIAWAVEALHLSFTAVLGELYEINDQLAGRKDEFKALFSVS
jgi:hypothetical protein